MKINVIVPAYNSEKYIERCLDSILCQTYHDWKAYIVDDGSTDNTLSLIEKYASDYRFNILSKQNEGAGAARNFALDIIDDVEGYIVFLDSDDYIKNDYFQLLSQHTEDIVFVDVEQTNENGKVIKKEAISSYRKNTKKQIIRKQLTGFIPWGGVRKAVRSSIVLNNHIRFSNLKVGEEALYSFKALVFSQSIGFIDKSVYSYCLRRESLSSTFNENPWGDVFDVMKNEIISGNLYDEFADALNTFAICACAVSLKRISLYRFSNFKNKAKELRDKMLKNIDKRYPVARDCFTLKAKVVYFLLKHNLFFAIYLIGKLTYKG